MKTLCRSILFLMLATVLISVPMGGGRVWAQAKKHYGRSCLGVSPSTCGAGYGIADIVGASDGETAHVPADPYYGGPLFYIYDEDSVLSESPPNVVDDDSVGGNQKWILQKLPVQSGGTGGDDAEEARTNLEINMSHLLSPDADSVFTMANYTMTYNWTTANPSSEIVFRKFDYAAEPDDADVIFFRHLAGDSNTIFWQCIGTVADGVVCGGDVLLNIESVNLLDGTDYMVGGYQIDHDDLAGLAPVKGGLPTVDKSASDSSLDPAEVLNTMINNDDSSAQVTLGLPAAVLGYAFIGFVAEAYKFCFDPNGSEIIVLDGVAQTGGNMVCSETTPTVGDEINCAVFDDGGTKKWRCVSILGTWSDGGA